MEEYISREEIVSEIRSRASVAKDLWKNGYNTAMGEMMQWIKRIPATDVEPVRHGRWEDLYVGDRQEEGFICTVCKEPCKCDFDYCPHCGAKMDGGEQA